MDSRLKQASEHWDSMTELFSQGRKGIYWWEAGAELQRQINISISGDGDIDWLQYSLRQYFSGKLPMERCLSLGVGQGWLERRLLKYEAFMTCDAYDISEESIRAAKGVAAEQGIDQINYVVGDINTVTLQESYYDAIFVSGAMHHFEALERVYEQIYHALKPGGYLFLNEYVGPNRFQFSDRQKAIGNHCLQLIPDKYKRLVTNVSAGGVSSESAVVQSKKLVSKIAAKIRQGNLQVAIQRRLRVYKNRFIYTSPIKTQIDFPSVKEVIGIDPSEAVRSEEVIPILRNYLEVCEIKEYGGNIFQFLLHGIAGNFSQDDEEARTLIRMITQIEQTMIRCGEFTSDYAYIAARAIK